MMENEFRETNVIQSKPNIMEERNS
jgi:hypothetical protein